VRHFAYSSFSKRENIIALTFADIARDISNIRYW